MSLQLHRPDERGVLTPEPGAPPDYREQLSSPRWGRAGRGGRLPALKNPEMRPTSTFVSVMFWVGLAVRDIRRPRVRLRHWALALPGLTIRGYEPARDLDWATTLLDAEFGGRLQARRGELIDALGDAGSSPNGRAG